MVFAEADGCVEYDSGVVDVDWYAYDGRSHGHRWYEHQTGRYTQPDPLGANGDSHPYVYAIGNPLSFVDALGERSRVCCQPAEIFGVVLEQRLHCFIHVQDNTTGVNRTYGLHRVNGKGCKYSNDGFDIPRILDATLPCGDWNESCDSDHCAAEQFDDYPNPSDYQAMRGPNSNSFARTVATACGLSLPALGSATTPGWDAEGRPARDTRFACPVKRTP